jgi:undecaprenyl-diphosphatase
MDLILLKLFNQTLSHPFLDSLMMGLTIIGFAMLPALAVSLVLSRSQRKTGVAILVSLLFSLSLVLTFQYLTLRPRPEPGRLLLPTPNFPSYPSGHAGAAFGVAVVVGLTYRKRGWWLLALGGASLIAFSRVYLGLHYPSDVAGGAILGAAAGAACFGLFGLAEPDWRWLLWPQVATAIIVSQMAYLDILPFHLLRWPLADKVFHFLLFGAVVFWLNLWLKGRKLQLGRGFIPLAILLPLTIAIVEEAAQLLSPLRTADLTDLTSDLAGMFFFWWLSLRFIKSEEA